MGAPSVGESYYAVLGVARDATPEEVRAAFRAVALDTHPDSGAAGAAAPEAAARFQHAKEAYDVLRRADSRAEYDAALARVEGLAGFGRGRGNAGLGRSVPVRLHACERARESETERERSSMRVVIWRARERACACACMRAHASDRQARARAPAHARARSAMASGWVRACERASTPRGAGAPSATRALSRTRSAAPPPRLPWVQRKRTRPRSYSSASGR